MASRHGVRRSIVGSAVCGILDPIPFGCFVAEHGSWNRSPLSGYAVVFVPFKDGQPAGPPDTLVSGFYSNDEKPLFGAPVELVQDKDDALLIADDVGNTVWRVTGMP